MTDKEIARSLAISEDTVAKHIGVAMRKLGATNRKAALRALGGVNVPYPSLPVSPPVGLDKPEHVDVDRTPEPPDAKDQGPSLYERYSGLGSWRTPPRSAGFRTSVVLGWMAFGLVLLLLIVAVTVTASLGNERLAPTPETSSTRTT